MQCYGDAWRLTSRDLPLRGLELVRVRRAKLGLQVACLTWERHLGRCIDCVEQAGGRPLSSHCGWCSKLAKGPWDSCRGSCEQGDLFLDHGRDCEAIIADLPRRFHVKIGPWIQNNSRLRHCSLFKMESHYLIKQSIPVLFSFSFVQLQFCTVYIKNTYLHQSKIWLSITCAQEFMFCFFGIEINTSNSVYQNCCALNPMGTHAKAWTQIPPPIILLSSGPGNPYFY